MKPETAIEVNPKGEEPPSRLARQVLRHIHDATTLQSNRLTKRFFRPALNLESSITTIRAIITASLPPGSRARHIVEQCDFNGRSHKEVCREMVLSERQFYRERALAFDLIAKALAHDPAIVTNSGARLALRIESLHGLLESGHTGAVRRAVEQSIADGVPGAMLTRLLALKATACAWDGDDVEADAAIRAAHPRASGDNDRADILAARAHGAYIRGQLGRSIELLSEAVRLTSVESVLSDPIALRQHVRHLYWLANFLEESDDAAGALRLLESAQGLLLTRSPGDVSLLLGLIKAETACATLCLPAEGARALDDLNEAHALACRIGSPALLAWVEATLACASLPAAPSDAASHARLAVEFGVSSLAGETLARILLTAARVFTVCGDAAGALGLIEIARPHCVSGRYLEDVSRFRHADALVNIGRNDDAVELAEEACTRIAGLNHGHTLGSAHIAAARANAGLGNVNRAMEHVQAAITLLERSGFLFESRRANQIAARISGDPVYIRRTREMDHLLNVS